MAEVLIFFSSSHIKDMQIVFFQVLPVRIGLSLMITIKGGTPLAEIFNLPVFSSSMGNQNKLMPFTVLLGILVTTVAQDFPIAKPGCQDRCGNTTIPYPFGTTPDCYYDEDFLITCNETIVPPKAFLTGSSIVVEHISLDDGKLYAENYVSNDCYNNTGGNTKHNKPWTRLSKFYISDTDNVLVAIGCDTIASIQCYRRDSNTSYEVGCTTTCDTMEIIPNNTCSGIGCCQTAIAKGVTYIEVNLKSYNSHRSVWNFNPCSYAFVIEKEKFNFVSANLSTLQNVSKVPLVLEWTLGQNSCSTVKEATMYDACQGNSTCVDPEIDPENGLGYRCKCRDGYQGNPYLIHGCIDVDECKNNSLNDCVGSCVNTVGSYACHCPKGYHGDGHKNVTGCTRNQPLVVQVIAGIAVPITALVVIGTWLYWGFNKLKLMKLKQKFFRENGGLMLQQELSRREGSTTDTAKIFTAEELEKATNNYDESTVLGRGGHGTVYKGTLSDGRTVAIKKSKFVDRSQTEQFINEVVVLSQINHRNVVKLIGCCLETEVPLLVYEFITNGTLYEHIHNKSKAPHLTWEIRLRIAAETAGVLWYLHSAASIPIIHRDIKSTNLLLDDNYTAKVSDFGTSRLVPADQDELSTIVRGTLGYLDPEYLHTSQLTDKSDVYSFGVVLVELLTGQKALSFERPEEDRNLAMYFLCALKEDRLLQVMEASIVAEENIQQLKEVASLAKRCLRLKGEERPTMKEVAMELEGLKMIAAHPWANGESSSDGEQYSLSEFVDIDLHGDIPSTSAGYEYDSMNNHVMPVNGCR